MIIVTSFKLMKSFLILLTLSLIFPLITMSESIELTSENLTISTISSSLKITKDKTLLYEETEPGIGSATLTLKSLKPWDFKDFQALEITLFNPTKERIIPQVFLKSPDSVINGYNPGQYHSRYLDPGERKNLLVYFLADDDWFQEKYPDLIGLRAGPNTEIKWWRDVDPSNISEITFSHKAIKNEALASKGTTYRIEKITPIRFHEKFHRSEKLEFPFIDKYGQFIHGDWPGKVYTKQDLNANIQAEKIDLQKYPEPVTWNKWGGWQNGPKQKATGYFRVQLIEGKWWFIDPSGCLFWSHGVTCVNTHGAYTITEGREHYFRSIPEPEDPKFQFLKSPKNQQQTYNFTRANLLEKYGDNWQNIIQKKHHKRLRSWGLNTIGNWSDDETQKLERTPFTLAIHPNKVNLGSKFPDLWHPDYETNLREAIEYAATRPSAYSPYHMGSYINNELHWESAEKFNAILFKASASQPAKKFFVSKLKEKFQTIQKLNKKWDTQFSNFNSLLEKKKVIPYEQTQTEVDAFYEHMCEKYFKLCRSEFKKVFPNHLYLGCRFHDHIDPVPMRIAQKYCDVISYNLYRKSIADFTGPVPNLSKPMMATEFHFGALDRGMFHTGLNYSSDQEDRAIHYYEFVKGALKNPLMLGTHWFQYGSQAFTGRGQDGENFQIGMLDITDTPYPELIQKVREIGYKIYSERYN